MKSADKQSRKETAELLKEQIYSSITLVALIVTLWQNAEHVTAWGGANTKYAQSAAGAGLCPTILHFT